MYTADVQTALVIYDGDWWPGLLVSHPLQQGGSWEDVTQSEYPGTAANAMVVRIHHVELTYFEAAELETPGCIKRGPAEEL